MAFHDSNKNSQDYLAACDRVLRHVDELAHARGIKTRLDIDPDREVIINGFHQLQLTCGRFRRVVSIDHEVFMDEEFFRTLVLHQIEAAMNDLAASV